MTRYAAMLALEIGFVVLFLAGVALVCVPAALMLGGLVGVVVTEREMAQKATSGRRKGGGP